MKHAPWAMFVLSLGLFVLSPLQSVHALSVSYSFTGHITSGDSCGSCPPPPVPSPSPLPDFSVGSSISGTVRYDTALLTDVDPRPSRGEYEQVIFGPSPSFVITMNVGGFVFRGDGPFVTVVETGPSSFFTYYSQSFDLIHAPSPVNYTWNGDEMGISLGDGLTNDNLPTTLSVDGHGKADLFLVGVLFGGESGEILVNARGQIDSFTPVPEPSTAFLMGVGILGLVAMRTSRRSGL